MHILCIENKLVNMNNSAEMIYDNSAEKLTINQQ